MKPPRIPWILGPDPTGLVIALTGDQIVHAGGVPAPKLTGAEHYEVPNGRVQPGSISDVQDVAALSDPGCLEEGLARGITTWVALVDPRQTPPETIREFFAAVRKTRVRAILLLSTESKESADAAIAACLVDPEASLARTAWAFSLDSEPGDLPSATDRWVDEAGRRGFPRSAWNDSLARIEITAELFGRRVSVLEVGAVGDAWVLEANGRGPVWIAGQPVFRPSEISLERRV